MTILGISYFRKFIGNFVMEYNFVEPLTKLTKKDASFAWQTKQEKAFNIIQDKLTTQPVLAIFNPDVPTEMHIDASAVGVRAILL